jgi:hypothetical protein
MSKKKKDINVECISGCYSKNDIVIHPLLLIPITEKNNNFCLTLPYKDQNEKIKYTYKCNSKKKKESNILIQNIHINSDIFLSYIYNINDFKEGINWIENNINISENTINRFLNNFWNVYINEIKYNYKLIIDLYFKYLKFYNKQIFNKKKDIKIKDIKMIELIDKTLNRIFAKYGKKETNVKYNDKFKKYINFYLNEKKK